MSLRFLNLQLPRKLLATSKLLLG